MMQNGIAYRLATLAPPILEIGSSLLPTPLASDSQAIKARSKGREPRNFLVGADFSKEKLDPNVKSGGPLNPTFLEFLMGFPAGWTDVER
jgi:hypothetical protein